MGTCQLIGVVCEASQFEAQLTLCEDANDCSLRLSEDQAASHEERIFYTNLVGTLLQPILTCRKRGRNLIARRRLRKNSIENSTGWTSPSQLPVQDQEPG